MQTDQKPIVGAIILAGAMIAGAILLRGSSPAPLRNDVARMPEIRAVSKDEHILGNPNAKITIVEYSDLECPFCKQFHAVMHRLVAERDDVAWVYRHFPLDCVNNPNPGCQTLHAKARPEAEAAECAWEQGGNAAFWQYVDTVFEITPSNDGLDSAELPKIAEGLGLDMAEWSACVANGKYADKVQADVDDGRQAGVRGTPNLVILKNGKAVDFVEGGLPYEALVQRIDAIK